MATASPICRTRSPASAGRTGMTSLPPLRPATGGCCDRFLTPAAAMSAAVITATTPLIASAAWVPTDFTSAWAWGERTKAA